MKSGEGEEKGVGEYKIRTDEYSKRNEKWSGGGEGGSSLKGYGDKIGKRQNDGGRPNGLPLENHIIFGNFFFVFKCNILMWIIKKIFFL